MQDVNIETGTKHLSFRLGEETYAVPILKVREIIGLMTITAVPKTAAHIRGVINLRGKIVPVLDMRAKFRLPEVELKRENCIITITAKGPDGELLIGILVDSVSEVLLLQASDVEPVPAMGDDMKLDFVMGLAKAQGRVTILLDIDRVIQSDDLGDVARLGGALADQKPNKEEKES